MFNLSILLEGAYKFSIPPSTPFPKHIGLHVYWQIEQYIWGRLSLKLTGLATTFTTVLKKELNPVLIALLDWVTLISIQYKLPTLLKALFEYVLGVMPVILPYIVNAAAISVLYCATRLQYVNISCRLFHYYCFFSNCY